MTPPDSGETKLCGHVERERMCLLPAGHAGLHGQDLDDSGEREVPCVCGEDPALDAYDGLCRDCWLGICWCGPDKHPPRKWAIDPSLPRREPRTVRVPLPLAQRILAALESWPGDKDLAEVAAELRAVVERKT